MEIKQLIAEHIKRLPNYIGFEIKELSDVKNAKNLSSVQLKKAESAIILQELSEQDVVMLLDEKGREFTSKEFATLLEEKMNQSIKRLVFVVGGAYGFSEECYERANGKIALSKMTFTHQMVRLFFVEQLYRAFSILQNKPYHNE